MRRDVWITSLGGALLLGLLALAASRSEALAAADWFSAQTILFLAVLAGLRRGLEPSPEARGRLSVETAAFTLLGAGLGAALALTDPPLLREVATGLSLSAGACAVGLGLTTAFADRDPPRVQGLLSAIGAAASGALAALYAAESDDPLLATLTLAAAFTGVFGFGALLGALTRWRIGGAALRFIGGWAAAAALMTGGLNAALSLGYMPSTPSATSVEADLDVAGRDLDAPRLEAVIATLLRRVYQAFEHQDEGAIYDALAEAVHGPVLETLYLQRRRAIERASEGGARLEAIALDQMTLASADRRRGIYHMDARWAVIGRVGHVTHEHLRRNLYEAAIVIAPIDGAWRITELELNDIRRDTEEQPIAAQDLEAAEQ